MTRSFDVVVIGAGPGGYVAAIRAAQLGLKVAIVDREHLGGICLNWGCIPTKALLKSAEIYYMAKKASEFGITFSDVKFDFSKIIERSRNVSSKLSEGIKHLLKKNKVEVILGSASITKTKSIKVEKDSKLLEELNAKNIIIATGARARSLANMAPDGKSIWSYKEAMVPKELPKSLLIIGSGAIGIEFASFYNMLGSKVTVVEMATRILPNEDHEISAIAHKSFTARGMTLINSATVKEIKYVGKELEVSIESKGKITKLTVEKVISAAGVVANVESIGIENTKIELERGFIKTDQYLETDEKNIFAIGDVTSPPWLAHKASHEGIIAAEKIAGQKPHAITLGSIPGCTYCYPQIASVGLTEEAAKAQGIAVKIGRFSLMANGKAIAIDESEGLIKTIFCAKTGEIVGAHMIGAEVTEMIQGISIAKTLEATELDLMHAIFPHPTISEAIHESVLDAYGRVIHF